MDKFKSFINNKMSEEESDQFLGDLLRKKLDRDQKEQWAQQLKDQYGVARNQPGMQASAGGKLGVTALWRVAAAITLLLCAVTAYYKIFSNSGYLQLADEFIQKDKLAYADLRKGDTDEVAERLNAIEAYQQADYISAIQRWNKLKDSGRFTTDDQFFLGLSYLYQGKPAAALETFEEHARRIEPGGKFEEENKYYTALTLLKLKRSEDAKQKLLELNKSTRTPLLQRRTAQLLERMK